ncbi:MAG TPA: vWA domain-containing protein [Vicinamibacterales bacterium]|jgi:Flp pilus assembly protein TadG
MPAFRQRLADERGYALIYLSITLVVLLIFTGLAVDTGRSYVVKAQLTKAVDGAALAAARALNSGDPRGEAVRIFTANFPPGYFGTLTTSDPTAAAGFFGTSVDPATGVNTVTVSATATLPTTFMQLANYNQVQVNAVGQATRRMVDMSIVLDVSSSIGSQWGAVRDSVRAFVDAFDPKNDRVALLTFGNGATVIDAMSSSRGFNKSKVEADVPGTLPGGSTNMVEGLYRGWDELRSVPSGQQSGLRVIVLFTDGASNSVPGNYDAAPGLGRALRTFDFPKTSPDPDGQTWDNPQITGLYDTATGTASPSVGITVANWNNKCLTASDFNNVNCASTAQYLPLTSYQANHRSSGIPTSFPLISNTLTVDGGAQAAARPLRDQNGVTHRFPAEVWNINNAARNLVEIVSDAARNDNGDYKIRIYTIGMGELVRYNLGTRKEMSEDILKRMANDATSIDFNSGQLEGKYYYAKTAADVGPAFQQLQNQIIRLSK